MNFGVIGFLVGLVGVILPFKFKKKFEDHPESNIEIKPSKWYWIATTTILSISFVYLLIFF